MQLITKIISNSKFKRFILVSALLILYVCISAVSYTHAVTTDIADSVFRLHVIANSDSAEDQNLKYIVRDKVIEYMSSISQNASSKEDVIEIAKANLDKIQAIASQTIRENGYTYSVNVEVGNFSFPSKRYGDITLPPGYYDALRIKIGEAEGQNWWCVMFPPLCFVDVTSGVVPDESKEIMKENLSKEEFDLISKNSNEVKVKFKIVEVLQNFTISGIFM
jgi:stage II sporulation protein R